MVELELAFSAYIQYFHGNLSCIGYRLVKYTKEEVLREENSHFQKMY